MNRTLLFKTNTIWFTDAPFDVEGVDSVTFKSCRNKVDLDGFRRTESSTMVFDLTQPTESLWGALGRTNRQRIKSAEKAGVKIYLDRDHDEFIELNDRFRRAKGLPPHSVSSEFMKKYGILVTAKLDGELLVGSFNLKDDKNIRGLISASKRLEVEGSKRSLVGNANRLMEWEIIRQGKERGVRTYDFGGYYAGNSPDPDKESINQFKDSFGGQVIKVFDYQKDYSPAIAAARSLINLFGQK